MKNSLAFRCGTLMVIGCCIMLSTTGAQSAGASILRASMAKYATQAQVRAAVASAQALKSAPAKVIPSIETLANGGDFGMDMAGGCTTPTGNRSSENITDCTFGDISSPTTLVLTGDSRAQMWFDAFDILAKSKHFKLLFLAKSGCPSPLATYRVNDNGTPSNSAWPACTYWQSFVRKTIDKLNPAYVVISSGESLQLADPVHFATPAEIEADMVAFLKELPTKTKAVVLGGFPTPGVASPTLCLSKGPSAVDDCNFTPSSTTTANNEAIQSAATAADAGYIDQTPWLCAATCPPIIHGIIPYTIDGYHIDTAYTEYLIGALWESLKPFVVPSG